MNSRLKVGDNAPEFSLSSLTGTPIKIGGASAAGKSTLLFFLSADCPICKEILPALNALARRERDNTQVVFVGGDDAKDHTAFAARHSLPSDSYVTSDAVGMAYAVAKLPYTVLMDERGVIASLGLVNNREHIESLFEAKRAGVASIQEYMKKSA